MGKSKLQIPKICLQCGNTFVAKTVKNVYCSEECCRLVQNEKKRKERRSKVLNAIKADGTEYITIPKALQIFSTTQSTIRRMIIRRRIAYRKISPAKRCFLCKTLYSHYGQQALWRTIQNRTTYSIKSVDQMHIFSSDYYPTGWSTPFVINTVLLDRDCKTHVNTKIGNNRSHQCSRR